MSHMPRVSHGFKKQVENPSEDINHKGPLLLQMPCPQLSNYSLNMVNRVITSALCKTANESLANVGGKGALFLPEIRTAKQLPDDEQ